MPNDGVAGFMPMHMAGFDDLPPPPQLKGGCYAPFGQSLPLPTNVGAPEGSMRAYDLNRPVFNFSPGPGACIPRPVLAEMQAEMLNWNGTGLSVMELSHRSPEFQVIIDDATARMRALLKLPDDYHLVFTPGGGSGAKSIAALNFTSCKDDVVDILVNGQWSQRAASEAEKYARVNIVNDLTADQQTQFDAAEWNLSENAKYLHICSNETIMGMEFHEYPDVDVPLVGDMSSDILSKTFDPRKFGAFFACAPKNFGPAGLTVFCVREDMIRGGARPECPSVFDLNLHVQTGCLWNTPPTWNIYATGKCLRYLQQGGGVPAQQERNARKAAMLYDFMDRSNGFYRTPITDKSVRSRMNVPFYVGDGSDIITNAFLNAAFEKNIIGLRTPTPHGVTNCLRASLYNCITEEQVAELVRFMENFMTLSASAF